MAYLLHISNKLGSFTFYQMYVNSVEVKWLGLEIRTNILIPKITSKHICNSVQFFEFSGE